MTAKTHSVFGVLALLTVAVLFGVAFRWQTVLFVVLGSLLPDIDTSASWIGRCFGPLTRHIERHFGHRTLTHSIIGVVCFSGIIIPLYFFHTGWYFGLLIGYVSHLVADLFTKAGICLYFPEMSRAVIPGRTSWRIEVGGRAEWVFLGLITLLTLSMVYLHSFGGVSLYLHRLFAQPQFAVEDYLSWCATSRVTAQGTLVNNLTGQELKGNFAIVGHIGERVLVGEIDGKLYAVGKSSDVNFYTKRIFCQQGEAIEIVEQRIDLSNRLVGDLLHLIDVTKEHYLFGTLELYEGVGLVGEPNRFRSITSSFRKLVFDYARWKEIQEYGLSGVLVHRGELLARIVKKAGQTAETHQVEGKSEMQAGPPSGAKRRTRRRMVYTIHRVKALFVNRLDRVNKGQVIAEVYRKQDSGDVTLLRSRLVTEAKLQKLAIKRINRNLKFVESELAQLRGQFNRTEHPSSVFSEYQRQTSQLRAKIRRLEKQKDELLLDGQAEREKSKQKIAELEQKMTHALKQKGTKEIRAQTDGVVALIEKQVMDQTVTAIISIVAAQDAQNVPSYEREKIPALVE